jgi:hypothetical protein
MSISVNEQVSGHKVVVTQPPDGGGSRQASCQCGWRSPPGRTEQVMPAIRSHLDAAVAARPQAAAVPRTAATGSGRPAAEGLMAAGVPGSGGRR